MKRVLLRLLLLSCLILCSHTTVAQDSVTTSDMLRMREEGLISDWLERSAANDDSEQDYSAIGEEIALLSGRAVDLNNAGRDEFRQIPFLDERRCQELEFYRVQYGDILSVYELLSIPGFDSLLVTRIMPYIRLGSRQECPAFSPSSLLRYGRHALMLRAGQSLPVSDSYGTTDSLISPGNQYQGSPQRYYFRYQYTWFDRLKIGLAGEKDPGEAFFSGAQDKGMDYYAWYLSLSTPGWLKRLVAGNFRAAFGQGLTIGTGNTLVPSPGFSAPASTGSGIAPDPGMNEGRYLRGLAATVRIRHFEISALGSMSYRDATLSEDVPGTGTAVSSIITTGYHRTEAEIGKRNRVRELLCGGHIGYTVMPGLQTGIRAGCSVIWFGYSMALAPKPEPYQLYAFSGREGYAVGADFRFRHRNFSISGEVSRSRSGGYAWLAGAAVTASPALSINLLCRGYQPLYQNPFSRVFSQGGGTCNENGVYLNITASPIPRVTLAGYLDLYVFPWLKYRVDTPSSGHEAGLMITWQAAPGLILDLRAYGKRARKNMTTLLPGQATHLLSDQDLSGLRGGMTWNASPKMRLSMRAEWKRMTINGEEIRPGSLVYQEIRLGPVKWLQGCSIRFAIFDAPDYDTRIYVYEPDVLYGFSMPAFQGRGIRLVTMFTWQLFRGCRFWLRGGITYYDDQGQPEPAGSTLNSNARTELTGQLQFRW